MISMPYVSRRFGFLGVGALLLSSSSSWALGLGNVTDNPVLGEALSITIPVLGAADERVPPECIRAEVLAGESLLVGRVVRTQVLPGDKTALFRVQVTTEVHINEPMITVSLDVGCTSPLNKQYTLFVDPPASVTTPLELSSASEVLGGTEPRLIDSSNSGTVSTSPAPSARKDSKAARPLAKKPRRAPDPAAVALQALAPTKVQTASARKASAKATGPRIEAPATAPGPRLSLEAPTIDALKSTSTSAQRDPELGEQLAKLNELEQLLSQIKAESQAARTHADGLQTKLQGAQEELERERQKVRLAEEALDQERQRKSEQPVIVWVLGGVVVVLAGALGLMLWSQRRKPGSFFDGGSASGMGQASGSFLNSESLQSLLPKIASKAAAPDSRNPRVTSVEISEVTESQMGADSGLPSRLREMAADELVDLEQQADFFMALGQTQAAIDLLSSDINGASSASPLPYLKLMEIYSTKSDRMSYEQLRLRFHRRFNARVPDWGISLNDGKTLDQYPEVSELLSSCWGTPASALPLLESYLFRSDEQVSSFDLPAYHELLLLYAVARDLVGTADPASRGKAVPG